MQTKMYQLCTLGTELWNYFSHLLQTHYLHGGQRTPTSS